MKIIISYFFNTTRSNKVCCIIKEVVIKLFYMNEELEQVEIKVSYLEAQVAELNEVVIEQQKNIDAMNIKLLQVTKKLEELIEEVGSPSRPNRKPPHY